MTKLPKFFLTISLTCFAVGAVVCFGNIEVHPSWMVSMPAGAIFFGLFLNAYVLQGEVASFDEETLMRIRIAANHTSKSGGAEKKLKQGTPALSCETQAEAA